MWGLLTSLRDGVHPDTCLQQVDCCEAPHGFVGKHVLEVKSYLSFISMALAFISAHMADFPFEKMITGCYRLDDVHFPERMNNLQQIKPVILV